MVTVVSVGWIGRKLRSNNVYIDSHEARFTSSQGKSFTLEATLVNDSNRPLQTLGSAVNCGCLRVDTLPERVDAHGHGTVVLRVKDADKLRALPNATTTFQVYCDINGRTVAVPGTVKSID